MAGLVPSIMPAKGLSLTDVPADVVQMFRTHELAREIGAPDLAESKTFGRDLISGKNTESTLTRATAIARGMTRAAMARKSLSMRPVEGFFACGHERTDANVYTGKHGTQCRPCRNASRREARAA